MTKQHFFQDTTAATIAYAAGLGALLLWPGRGSLTFGAAVLIGFAVIGPVNIAVAWFAFKRSPRELFGLRPLRDSLPAFPAFLAAFALGNAIATSERADQGVIAFAVWTGLVFVGVVVSNWWWACATDRPAT